MPGAELTIQAERYHGRAAKEARAVHYIDRVLASHNSGSRQNYRVGLSAINEFAGKTRGADTGNAAAKIRLI